MGKFHQNPHISVSEVHIKIENIERSLAFYQEIIGLKILERSERKAVLTADGKTPLLTIEQPKNIIPKQPRTTGLYHFALLLPSRSDLGRVFHHFIQKGYPLQGASDHSVSEAIYLADPDGNGIEIYSDRPPETWNWNQHEIVMSTEPMDIQSVLDEAKGQPWEGIPEDTLMGHIHLHVSDLTDAEEFYCDGLGFNIVSRYGGHALFISTGGYHHHIGLNTWNGVGAPTPSKNSVGLAYFTLLFPTDDARMKAVEQLRNINAFVSNEGGAIFTEDPSGNRIQLLIHN